MALGARCIVERSDNDLDFEAGLDRWDAAVFATLPEMEISEPPTATAPTTILD